MSIVTGPTAAALPAGTGVATDWPTPHPTPGGPCATSRRSPPSALTAGLGRSRPVSHGAASSGAPVPKAESTSAAAAAEARASSPRAAPPAASAGAALESRGGGAAGAAAKYELPRNSICSDARTVVSAVALVAAKHAGQHTRRRAHAHSSPYTQSTSYVLHTCPAHRAVLGAHALPRAAVHVAQQSRAHVQPAHALAQTVAAVADLHGASAFHAIMIHVMTRCRPVTCPQKRQKCTMWRAWRQAPSLATCSSFRRPSSMKGR
jgi:hypothetical protein